MKNVSKQIIAVDIDEVLSPLHDVVFAHHNAVYGTNYPARDPSGKYYIDQFSGDDYETNKKKFKKFVESDEFRAILPIDGSVQAIDQLSRNYELIIITARQDFYKEFTLIWLERHYPQLFKEVHFTEYVPGKGVKISKSVFCRQIGASYMIDDNLEHALDVARAGIQTILFGDYPWNKVEKLPENVTRRKDWDAVLEYFDGRS